MRLLPNCIAVHRTGLVTYWHPTEGRHANRAEIPPVVWRALSQGERDRVLRVLCRYAVTQTGHGGIWIGNRCGAAGGGLTERQAQRLVSASAALRRIAKAGVA